jgi:hypothetical protein
LAQLLAADSNDIYHFLNSNCAKDSAMVDNAVIDIDACAVTRYNQP